MSIHGTLFSASLCCIVSVIPFIFFIKDSYKLNPFYYQILDSKINFSYTVYQFCIFQSSKAAKVFKEKAAEFLLQWEALGALLLRDLTLRSASSFGMYMYLNTNAE